MTELGTPLTFTNAQGSITVHEHGAHVMQWAPTGQRPVLWMSEYTMFDDAAPIRGGVPICLPWFGAGRTGEMKPAHGFARITKWALETTIVDDDGIRLAFVLEHAADDAFPHAMRARLEITAGASLELALVVTNTGDAAFSFEEALHTYFSIGDIRAVRIEGLDGAKYLDKAPDALALHAVQDGVIEFDGETDRVYSSTGTVRLIDPIWERTITVTKEHSANTVVWNPWIKKAAAMPDFGDNEWTGMVCIEGANVLADAITLEPGNAHTMRYRVDVAGR